jgi:hypothetical protein
LPLIASAPEIHDRTYASDALESRKDSGFNDEPNTAGCDGWVRNSQDLWIGVSRDLLITTLCVVGSSGELAVLEYRAGTDQRDEVGCVDGPPPGLC